MPADPGENSLHALHPFGNRAVRRRRARPRSDLTCPRSPRARPARPQLLAWVGLLALSVPLAVAFAALGIRHPDAGGTASYARTAFGPRAARATGWWFLIGVAVGAPAVAMIGGFYVAELVGGGRETAVVAAAAMIAVVIVANAASLRTTARLQLVLAAVLAGLLLVASLAALPARQTPSAGPVRAARLGRDRHRRDRADVLLLRLGGRLAPGR